MSLPSNAEVDHLGQQIDAIPDLSGAGIGFVGDDACTVLRVSSHTSGLNAYVVLPLATVVIGGIISSTVLGLIVLPVMLRLLVGSRPVSED